MTDQTDFRDVYVIWVFTGHRLLFELTQLLSQTETGKVITKTRLFKYIENFTTKNWKFSDRNSYFCSKPEAVLMSTHNLCF